MVEFTILFVGVLLMGYLVEKESKLIQRKNKDVWIFSGVYFTIHSKWDFKKQ